MIDPCRHCCNGSFDSSSSSSKENQNHHLGGEREKNYEDKRYFFFNRIINSFEKQHWLSGLTSSFIDDIHAKHGGGMVHQPDRIFYNLRALKSVDRRNLGRTGTSIDGFPSSKIGKRSVGKKLRDLIYAENCGAGWVSSTIVMWSIMIDGILTWI